jgi:hypothetical protein
MMNVLFNVRNEDRDGMWGGGLVIYIRHTPCKKNTKSNKVIYTHKHIHTQTHIIILHE